MKKTVHLFSAFVLLLLVFCLCASSAFAENIGTFTVNSDIGVVTVITSDSPITGCTLSSGSLCSGVAASWDENGVYLSGVPASAGEYSADFSVQTADGIHVINISMTVNAAPVEIPAAEPVMPSEQPVSDGGELKITKQPYGETVEVGGTAKFIARADNADQLIWRLVSRDTTVTYPCADAPGYFNGLKVSGIGTDTIVLSNIPASLDGWSVECKFVNSYGAVYSNGAVITVIDPSRTETAPDRPAAPAASTPVPTAEPQVTEWAKSPNIITQPESAELKAGESVTLSVVATSPNNGVLSYQWYSSPNNNVIAATPISGATSESYTVNQREGTQYYWVAIKNAKENSISEATYTQAAMVRVAPVSTPTPSPTSAPSPTPAGSSSSGSNLQLILFAIIGFLALAALVGVVIYLRMVSKQEDDQ